MNNKKLYKNILSCILMSFCFILFILPAMCASAFKSINTVDVKSEINAPVSKMILVDVRTPEEYSKSHIKTSINIPLNLLEKEINSKNLPKNSFIVVYCKTGVRAEKAATLLDSLGYSNIYNLGGILDWPYEIERPNQ